MDSDNIEKPESAVEVAIKRLVRDRLKVKETFCGMFLTSKFTDEELEQLDWSKLTLFEEVDTSAMKYKAYIAHSDDLSRVKETYDKFMKNLDDIKLDLTYTIRHCSDPDTKKHLEKIINDYF